MAVERALYRSARRLGLHLDSTAVERIAQIEDAAFASPVSLTSAFSTALGPTLSQSSAPAKALDVLFRTVAAGVAPERFVPFADVAPALRRLADMGVPRVALSAGWPALDQYKADTVGFDGSIVFAWDRGVSSTTSTAFAQVAQRLRLPADRIWFVGSDARQEILPASAAGLRTIWLNRNGAERPAELPSPDATISSLAVLFDVLAEPYTRGLLALRHILRTTLDWRPGDVIATDDLPGVIEREP